jgi:hypothetical protein
MQILSRDILKDLFSEVKHFRNSSDLEEVEFDSLFYYSWLDQTDQVFYTVFFFDKKIMGIRWKSFRLPSKPLGLGLCDICKKHRKRDEVISISAETKILPKNVNYRTRGFHICLDYKICNEDLKTTERLDLIYSAILN